MIKRSEKLQFIDLAIQQKRIKDKIDANIAAILDHGKYIMGPEVSKLENHLAEYVGVAHAIGCASGTDALLLALLANQIGPGDAVFTSPFTFIATAEVISLLGATPVFVDIDPQTFNIDPDQLQNAIQAIENNDPSIHALPAIDSASVSSSRALKAKAIIAVDLFGLPADYDPIEAIAEDHGLIIIEDAAQSFGAELNGKMACSFGNIACTSFFPAKPLGCYGDGGMCFTNDERLSDIMESLRVHGKGHHKYDNVRIGVNGRLDTIQAGILLAKFDIFAEETELRQQVADRYATLLHSCPDIKTPVIPPDSKSAWAQYSVLAADGQHRSDLQKKLRDAGVPTAIYYPTPLHLQSAFSGLNYDKGDFPVSEESAECIFSLPMYPYLTEENQQEIAGIMGK
jgi:UDP-2-acetamido-2-deoxy-ribo-hexuluronate aminotransferase